METRAGPMLAALIWVRGPFLLGPVNAAVTLGRNHSWKPLENAPAEKTFGVTRVSALLHREPNFGRRNVRNPKIFLCLTFCTLAISDCRVLFINESASSSLASFDPEGTISKHMALPITDECRFKSRSTNNRYLDCDGSWRQIPEDQVHAVVSPGQGEKAALDGELTWRSPLQLRVSRKILLVLLVSKGLLLRNYPKD